MNHGKLMQNIINLKFKNKLESMSDNMWNNTSLINQIIYTLCLLDAFYIQKKEFFV